VARAKGTITFTGTSIGMAVVAGPAGGPDDTFRMAGMVNPAIIVLAGSRVSMQVINADPDTAHGLVITASSPVSSWMRLRARPGLCTTIPRARGPGQLPGHREHARTIVLLPIGQGPAAGCPSHPQVTSQPWRSRLSG
jgi:hypothetical protein